MRSVFLHTALFFAAVVSACGPNLEGIELLSVTLHPEGERGQVLEITLSRQLPAHGNYYYWAQYTTRGGSTFEGGRILTTSNHMFDPGPTYYENIFLALNRRHSPPGTLQRIRDELNPGNIASLHVRVTHSITAFGERDLVAERVFRDL